MRSEEFSVTDGSAVSPHRRFIDKDVSAGLRRLLEDVFGYSLFRPYQEEVVRSILSGRDSFAVLPTGGGKSLCFQMPALVLPGTTIVVSPLLALMKDQIDAAAGRGIHAASVNSNQSTAENDEAFQRLLAGELHLFYVSPERLSNPSFRRALQSVKVNLIAVDEAHCISQWGHDFRPDYRKLQELRDLLPDVPIAAFTATATREVQQDAIEQLGLVDPFVVRASFNRPNLTYRVIKRTNYADQIISFARKRTGASGIVYRTTRKDVEETALLLSEAGVSALPYHAGMDRRLRVETQERFLSGDVSVIVATIAFGMGVDKPDVRFVIHADLPKDIESYFQETGRAGRDGEPADCILLYNRKDKSTIEYFISQIDNPVEAENATRRLESVLDYAQTMQCRREYLLGYFGERMTTVEKPCCDRCERSAKSRRNRSSHASPVGPPEKNGDSYMHRQKQLHANAYAPWSPGEEDELKKLAAEGYTTQQISRQLRRNTGAIRSRLRKLGLADAVRNASSAEATPSPAAHGHTDRAEVEAAILTFLRQFPIPFYRTRLARVLKGVGWAATPEMEESTYFGMFSAATRKSLVEVMDVMVEEGTLVTVGRQIKLPPRSMRAGGTE